MNTDPAAPFGPAQSFAGLADRITDDADPEALAPFQVLSLDGGGLN